MPEANGKNWWIRWLVGSLYGIVLLAVTTLATNVIANDKSSRDRDSKIEYEVSGVKEQLARIDTKLIYIERGQEEQKVNIQRILNVVEGLRDAG